LGLGAQKKGAYAGKSSEEMFLHGKDPFMTRVLLIRHAEPEAAWGGGDLDPGLSARGHEQARAAATRLVQVALGAAISSPMRRCQETAAPFVAPAGLDLRLEPGVSEVVSPAGVVDRRAWLLENFPWTTPGLQRSWASVDASLREWRDRVVAAIITLREDTAVFSHFIAINAIVGAALGRDETIVCRPDHASITEIRLENGVLRLVQMGPEMSQGDVR
jgi:broad specificity phosphatase PhoE